MKTTKHKVQRLLLAVVLLGMAACLYGRLRGYQPQSERSDRRAAAGQQLQDRNQSQNPARACRPDAGAHVPVFGESGRRALCGLYRRHGRHVAEQVRDLQCFGRLAEVALRERHQRDLPGLPRHHQRYGRRDGPRACRCLPHCNHAARDGFLWPDSLHADHGRQDRIARGGLRHAAGGIHGDV